MKISTAVSTDFSRLAVCGILISAVSCAQEASTTSPKFQVVNVRIEETVKQEGDGTCRQFNTAVTIATADPLFRDRTGLAKILVRDTAERDREENGGWVLYHCELLPTSVDAKRYEWLGPNHSQPQVDKKKFTGSCQLDLFKYCYDGQAGGNYETHHPVQRERPAYEFKLLSWNADSSGGSLIQ